MLLFEKWLYVRRPLSSLSVAVTRVHFFLIAFFLELENRRVQVWPEPPCLLARPSRSEVTSFHAGPSKLSSRSCGTEHTSRLHWLGVHEPYHRRKLQALRGALLASQWTGTSVGSSWVSSHCSQQESKLPLQTHPQSLGRGRGMGCVIVCCGRKTLKTLGFMFTWRQLRYLHPAP